MAAATRNPSTATTVAENSHSEPDVPRAVTTITSPRTMIVNSAKRSGILLSERGIATHTLRASGGAKVAEKVKEKAAPGRSDHVRSKKGPDKRMADKLCGQLIREVSKLVQERMKQL